MDVVVVESPAKAKTINKYLGGGYTVLASFGHVRDLPAKDGSVRPDEDFAMDWESEARSEKRIREIADALSRGAKHLYLATDPDREGEAISWHVKEMLKQRKLLGGIDVKRIVFHEITRSAVTDALKHPRELDHNLVDAYMARRALDYLVGFTLSPVLWRKLPGARSAGRVQSVALRLICERESEIELFKSREYWTIDADFRTAGGGAVQARLTHLDGRKLDKFDLPAREAAEAAAGRIAHASFAVQAVERKQVRRHPPPPFTTSTLQQESSRKLGFGASRTMQIAQRLYEGVDIEGDTVGLITYMRTDSVQLSREAIDAARAQIGADYGREYLPEQPRVYKSAAKNAQEAHEAIRPTNFGLRPQEIARHLDPDQLKLYELIWKRALASEMESATLDQVAVDIASPDGNIVLRATGSVVQFDGFLKLYREDEDDPAEDGEAERRLPDMAEGQAMAREAVRPEQHFTQPPPRYTEASLVKRLEELGIGRPSTYASIIQVLQDRNYVTLDKRRFVPQDCGRLVIAFLASYFERYVEYSFTAALEDKLDDISGERIDWKTVLRDFWRDFSAAVDGTKELRVRDVLDRLDADLGPHFFPVRADGTDPRKCPSCEGGRLGLKLGRHGAFIGCANYPDCKFTCPLAVMDGSQQAQALAGGKRELGQDPATGKPVTLRLGPYGLYVQLGETPPPQPKAKKKKAKSDAPAEPGVEKPKRVSLPKHMAPDALTLDRALALLRLPRVVGKHPETQQDITAGIGRFGPYVRHDGVFKSLPADEDVLVIGINRAVDLLATAGKGARRRQPGKELGVHPQDQKPVTLHQGRYGPYVAHGRVYASLPRGMNENELTLDAAVAMLAAKSSKGKKAAKAEDAGAETAAPAEKKPKKAAKAKPKAANQDRAARLQPASKPAKKRAAGG
jgi:DNA topoisomerase-1